MTQKFWNTWRKRAGETKVIKLNNSFIHPTWRGNLLDSKFHKFEDFDFTPDAVTIKFFNMTSHNHIKITLLRTDINTVEF